jgi:hypothetical protein
MLAAKEHLVTMKGFEYLDLLADPATREPTLGLLVHVAFSDGFVQEDEFALLRQLVPERDDSDLLMWVQATADHGLDVDALKLAFATDSQRWSAMRFAARMAWMDRQFTANEKAVLVEIAAALDMSRSVVETVLAEMVGSPSASPDPSKVADALDGMMWEELEFLPGAATGMLGYTAPSDAVPVGRLALEGVEKVILYTTGMAAAFREGDGWMAWSNVKTWSRVPVFGAAVRIETRDFRARTLEDVRLRPVGSFLDRVFAA